MKSTGPTLSIMKLKNCRTCMLFITWDVLGWGHTNRQKQFQEHLVMKVVYISTINMLDIICVCSDTSVMSTKTLIMINSDVSMLSAC